MPVRAESDEVARVRALLAQMTRAKAPDPAGTDAPPAPKDAGAFDAVTCRRPGRRPAGRAPSDGPCAAAAASDGGPVVAWRVDEPAGGGRARAGAAVAWGADGPEGEEEGRVAVPRCVARKFGSAPRPFASQTRLDAYLADLSAQTAFERVETALRSRERSAAEMTRRLADDGFAPEQARAAVERAVRCGLVDDARYAETFVASKVRAGWGRARIERELARGGVDPRRLLEGWPEAYLDRDGERERARTLLAKKPVPAKNPVEKLARFLVTKGYDPGCALSLARERVGQEERGGKEGMTD